MGKVTGFLEVDRATPKRRPVEERLKDWQELEGKWPEKELQDQGSRCMDCGIPYCHNGCPVNNLIPDWNDLVYHQDWRSAIEVLHSTNNFPEFTGRICPAPCEAACTLNLDDAPVTIKTIECSIIDKAWEEGWIQPQVPAQRTGKRVAVVGSGPAGLAYAQQLARAGHEVTLAVPHDPSEVDLELAGLQVVQAEPERLGEQAAGHDWVLLHAHLGNHYLSQRDDLPVVVEIIETESRETDIWYTFISYDHFNVIDVNFEPGGPGGGTDSGTSNVASSATRITSALSRPKFTTGWKLDVANTANPAASAIEVAKIGTASALTIASSAAPRASACHSWPAWRCSTTMRCAAPCRTCSPASATGCP